MVFGGGAVTYDISFELLQTLLAGLDDKVLGSEFFTETTGYLGIDGES